MQLLKWNFIYFVSESIVLIVFLRNGLVLTVTSCKHCRLTCNKENFIYFRDDNKIQVIISNNNLRIDILNFDVKIYIFYKTSIQYIGNITFKNTF